MPFSKETWRDGLAIPAIAAPMFLVSGPDLVVETCRSGIMGTFPALNQKTSEGYAAWLDQIQERLDQIESSTGVPPCPFGVNLLVHTTNARLARDVEITVQHRVPVVITSLGAVRESTRCIPTAASCSTMSLIFDMPTKPPKPVSTG
jgi:nitronate monooxygenase